LFKARGGLDLLVWHHCNVSETNGGCVSLTPIVTDESPNHNSVVSDADVFVRNQLLRNEPIRADTHRSDFLTVYRDWQDGKIISVRVNGPIRLVGNKSHN
jgi:hypothetical protein